MEQPQAIRFSEGELPTSAVGQVQVSRNGRGRQAHSPLDDDADVRYAAALKLVQTIDHNLQKGTRHYYDSQGRLLSTLDEVIHAMLTDSLVLSKPAKVLRGEESLQWSPVGELAA
jgi:hypothetical protein